MAYDIFLVSAIEDRDMAKLIARRLRALKFKVWFDQKQTDETFDPKDARNAMNSTNMLVLWSAAAVKSDWVRAAVSIANSREGALVQVGLDKTTPYAPFKADKRYSVVGMTSRKTPEGFYQSIEEIGRRQDRTDLREWMKFKSGDDEARAAWLSAHPDDAIAEAERKKREKKLGQKPSPAPEAAVAATLAAAAMGKNGTTKATREASAASAAGKSGIGEGSKRTEKTPQSPEDRGLTTPAAAITAEKAPSARYAGRSSGQTLHPPVLAGSAQGAAASDKIGMGWGTIGGVLAAIAAMLFLGWIFRSHTLPPQGVGMTAAKGVPAVGNAYPMYSSGKVACPAGQVPRALMRVMEKPPLETGVIIDDTKDVAE